MDRPQGCGGVVTKGVKLKDKDKGYRELVKRVYGLQKPVIEVGILAEQGAEPTKENPELTVLEIAIWNEFGYGVPERSFIRAWFDENEKRARGMVSSMMGAVIAGKISKEKALERLAQKFVGEIQRRMAEGIPPPNAPSTIKKKGSDKPLIDTGQLRSSISYKVTP